MASTKKQGTDEQDVKEEAAENPSRDDVHEQREKDQPREGTVRTDTGSTRRADR